MDKRVVILAVLAAAGGVGLGLLRAPAKKAEKSGEEVFAPNKLKMYAENTHIRVLDDGKGPGGRGSGPVLAAAVTPFGVRSEQISPTGYGALKALRRQFPKSDWIAVFIAEDSSMAEASNWIGLAQYRKGEVTVTGGIPSESELAAQANSGQAPRRPTQEDLKVVAAIFDSMGTLSMERWELSQTLLAVGQGRLDKSRFLDFNLETNSLHAVAKSLGRTPQETQAIFLAVCRFYWLKAGDKL